MPSVGVGINVSGMIDYFRQGKEMETFKRIRPQVLQKMQAALKPTDGSAPDPNAADMAVFEGMMQFQEEGGSEEAATRLFEPINRVGAEWRKRYDRDIAAGIHAGTLEATGTPGQMTYRPVPPFMERVLGGGQAAPGAPAAHQGGTLLPSLSSPTATAPPLAPVRRPPLHEQTLGGTEQPMATPPTDTPAQGAGWQSQMGTREGRDALRQKIAPYAVGGSPAEQKQAAGILNTLSALDAAEQKTRGNITTSAPQYFYDAQGNLQPVFSTTNKETGQISFNRPLEGLSKEARKPPVTTTGGTFELDSGGYGQQEFTTDPRTGKRTAKITPLPPGARPLSAKDEAGEAAYQKAVAAGVPPSEELQREFLWHFSKPGQDQGARLRKQIAELEKKKDVMEHTAQQRGFLFEGDPSGEPGENEARAEREALMKQLDDVRARYATWESVEGFMEPPPGGTTPGRAVRTPSPAPTTGRQAPTMNWAERALGR